MTTLRTLTTFTFTICATALAACSSAPPSDETQSGSNASAMLRPAPCWMNNNGVCEVWQDPMPPGGSFEMELIFDFGCSRPQSYYFDGHRARERFTICPKSGRLTQALVDYNATHRPPNIMGYFHEVDGVCDACLSPAPPGETYVFWGYIYTGPTCQGMNCGSPY